MSSQTVQKVIDTIHQHWPVDSSVEITLEANPTSVEVEKFKEFASAGINRVSLGIQSLHDEALHFLGRTHSAHEARTSIDVAARLFPRYSFDLMYARPGQTMDAWSLELEEALKLSAGHLSLYQFTIEEGTPFHLAYHRGDFIMPSENQGSDFYTHTNAQMDRARLSRYEISNYARKGHESIHNLTYWTYQDYIGVGPGAHSRLTRDDVKYALRRHRSPELWLETVQKKGNGTHVMTPLPRTDQISEFTMMGLRLKDGIERQRFIQQTGRDFLEAYPAEKLNALIQEKLLKTTSQSITLTSRGQQRLDAILSYLLPPMVSP